MSLSKKENKIGSRKEEVLSRRRNWDKWSLVSSRVSLFGERVFNNRLFRYLRVSTREDIGTEGKSHAYRVESFAIGLDGPLMPRWGRRQSPRSLAEKRTPVGSARANNAVFRSDQLSRWMLPPTQILIQTSACSCPDASLSRLTITVAAELSAPHANIYPGQPFVSSFIPSPLVLPIELTRLRSLFQLIISFSLALADLFISRSLKLIAK